jgi:RNA polymerase sigma-70 factor (ECF subfamily)
VLDRGGGDDEASLLAARTDPEAYAAFYDRRAQQVLAWFYRRTLCPHTSAELMAETFAAAWEHRHRYDPAVAPPITWLLGIARNQYRTWVRKGVVSRKARRRWGIATPALVADDLEAIERLVDLAHLRAELQGALDRLSPAVREAVLLRVAMDLHYEEVAAQLGCSVGAARVRVSRGLQQLHDRLGTEEDEP